MLDGGRGGHAPRKKRSPVTALKREFGVSPPRKKARGKKKCPAQAPVTESFSRFRRDQFRSKGKPPTVIEITTSKNATATEGSRSHGDFESRSFETFAERPAASAYDFKASPAPKASKSELYQGGIWVAPMDDEGFQDAPWQATSGPFSTFTVTPPSPYTEARGMAPVQSESTTNTLLDELIAVFF